MKKMLLATIVISLLLLGCSSNKATTKESKDVKKQNMSLTELIGEKVYSEKPEYYNVEFLELEENTYIAVTQTRHRWEKQAWYIEYNGKEITQITELEGVGGNILKSEKIQLNGKTYVQFYTATNQGNGSALLWNIETKKVDAEFSGVIDMHYEDFVSKKKLKKYDITATEEEQYNYSLIYQGDCLNSTYTDVNKDGNTDVVFCGTQALIKDEPYEVAGVSYIKDVYLYDEQTNSFVESGELSESKVVE